MSSEHDSGSVRPPRCAAILVYCSVRDWTRFYVIGLKNIWIQPSTRYRIRCGFIFFHSGPVHTLSDSLRIYFFHSGERICFFSGFTVEFWRIRVDGNGIRKEKVADSKLSGYVWTGPKPTFVFSFVLQLSRTLFFHFVTSKVSLRLQH